MKYLKECLLIMMVLLCIKSSYAQLAKGSFLVGGSLGFSSVKSEQINSNPSLPTITTSPKNFNINVSPNVSYFITDRFTVGLIVPYYYSHSGSASSTTVSIGPVVRYYFPFDKWAVFPELSYRAGTSTVRVPDYKSTANLNTYSAGAGVTYFINTHVGIEGILRYQQSDRKETTVKSKTTYLFFNIGLQVYLNKKFSFWVNAIVLHQIRTSRRSFTTHVNYESHQFSISYIGLKGYMTPQQFTQEFEASRRHLRSYILRMTASAADTEDIVQDTYIKALEKLQSFRGESSLKTWLFTIASNLAKDNLRSKKRWTENVTDLSKAAAFADPDFFGESMNIHMTSPQGQFEIKEHIAFCFTCISKSLPLEQQISLLLKEIYEFKVIEIALILDLTEAMVKYYLHTGRTKMTDVYEGRCALINKNGICHQCSELNSIFNPKQKLQEELMKIELAREAGKSDKEHLFDLRMDIVRGIDPFESNAAELQLHHLEHNRKVMEKYLEKNVN